MNMNKPLQVAVLSGMAFVLQSSGHAQGNLVNLYDWTDESTPLTGLIDVYSSNSAVFVGAYANSYGQLNQLDLSGSIATEPDITYEVTFALQNESPYDSGIGSVAFGNCGVKLDYAFSPQDSYFTSQGYVFLPVNYDFTTVATSLTTTISLDFILDEGVYASVSNFTITEVPETCSGRLYAFGGCALLLAQQLWRCPICQQLSRSDKRS
jgi:hypothetical protein